MILRQFFLHIWFRLVFTENIGHLLARHHERIDSTKSLIRNWEEYEKSLVHRDIDFIANGLVSLETCLHIEFKLFDSLHIKVILLFDWLLFFIISCFGIFFVFKFWWWRYFVDLDRVSMLFCFINDFNWIDRVLHLYWIWGIFYGWSWICFDLNVFLLNRWWYFLFWNQIGNRIVLLLWSDYLWGIILNNRWRVYSALSLSLLQFHLLNLKVIQTVCLLILVHQVIYWRFFLFFSCRCNGWWLIFIQIIWVFIGCLFYL